MAVSQYLLGEWLKCIGNLVCVKLSKLLLLRLISAPKSSLSPTQSTASSSQKGTACWNPQTHHAAHHPAHIDGTFAA